MKAKDAKAKPGPSTREVFPHGIENGQVEQGSPEWYALRRGLPTASNFGTIMASGRDGGESKTRQKLLYDLAGELLTGESAESFSNAAMERGKKMEEEAREHYAFTRGVVVERIGFVRNKLANGVVVGCSPDGFVGRTKGLEIKTMIPRLIIEQLVRGAGMPTEHRAQVQGTILVAELESVDLALFYHGMPKAPVFTVERDEVFIKQLTDEIERFDYELRTLLDKVRRQLGVPTKGIDVAREAIPR